MSHFISYHIPKCASLSRLTKFPMPMYYEALRSESQVAAEWQYAFSRLNRGEPGISGLMAFVQVAGASGALANPTAIGWPLTPTIIQAKDNLPAALPQAAMAVASYCKQHEFDRYWTCLIWINLGCLFCEVASRQANSGLSSFTRVVMPPGRYLLGIKSVWRQLGKFLRSFEGFGTPRLQLLRALHN